MADDDTRVGTVPPDVEPEPELVAGRYQVVRWLGGGGMGRVYEVYDVELEVRVALKMLRRGLSDDSIDRFRREVRLTRKIQHPNVARMFDIGDQHGERFLTMELVDGAPLTQDVGRMMPWPRLQHLATQICAGLAAAHDAGVVHRDLKPDNVMIERGTDRIVITDFGIARSGDDVSVTQVGAVVGTPRYMSPEQLAGSEVDARADVFSLGVMLYELASGTRPWPGENAIAIAVAQATQPMRPLISTTVPAAFVTLVEACLAIDPTERPQSATIVGAAIAAMSTAIAPARDPHATTPPPFVLATPTAAVETAVAVLPFACAAGDEHLALGVREDLIDTLSTTASLRVRPAGTLGSRVDLDPRMIGAELAVDHVVAGSVRRTPSGLRVAARLIGVADGFQIWARHVDCTDAEILAVSEQLGQAIASALSTRAPSSSRPTDPRAVELYLRARAEMRRFWGEHAQNAATLLEQAVAISPTSPPISAGYACAAVQAWVKQSKPELLGRAQLAVERALALGHPDAYLASSVLRSNLGDFEGGASDLAIGMVRAPMSPLANEIAGRLFVEIDPGPAGRRYLETSIALDPGRESLVNADLARLDALHGDWESANRRMAKLRADPDPSIQQMASMFVTRFAGWQRDVDGLLDAIKDVEARFDGRSSNLLSIVRDWHTGKRFDEAAWHRAMTAFITPDRPKRLQLVALQRSVEIALLVGQPDHAVDALRVAASIGLVDVVWLDHCPLFAGAGADPRWAALRDEVAARASRMLVVFRAGLA